MSIKFDEVTIAGANGAPRIGSYQVQTMRRYYYGLIGQTEIRGGRGGRPIAIDMWIFNSFDNYQAVIDYIDTNIYYNIGARTGTLVLLGDTLNNYNFPECTLDSFEYTITPFEDIAGTVDDGKWFAGGTLTFWQLFGGPVLD